MNKILVGKEIEGESYYTHDFVEMLSKQNTDLKQENKRLHSIIKEVREYIENNTLYYQDADYDYEENIVLGIPDDRVAKNDILEILDKVGSDEK